MQARRRKWIGSGAVTGSEWQHQHAAARGAEQRNFIRWGMERGGGEGKSCKADEIFTRNETRHYGVTCHDKRGLSYVRYWIIDGRRVLGYSCVACIDGLTVRRCSFFPWADFSSPPSRKSDSPWILLVQLSISRRLDLFFFFGRAKRRNVTKRILFLFFLSSFPPRGGAEWFVIRCIRECRKRFDSIFNRERLYGGVWMWWKFEE